jgi:hypothetical protein
MTTREPVAVIGADEAAAMLLKELARSPQWRVAAIFVDDPMKQGRQIQGVGVIGAVREVPANIERLGIRHAIIAMPAASHNARRSAVKICTDAGLKVMTVPSYDDLVSGKVTVSQIRHVELMTCWAAIRWCSIRRVSRNGSTDASSWSLALAARSVSIMPPDCAFWARANGIGDCQLAFMREQDPANPVDSPCVIGASRTSWRQHIIRCCTVGSTPRPISTPLMTENAWQAVLNNVAQFRGSLCCCWK